MHTSAWKNIYVASWAEATCNMDSVRQMWWRNLRSQIKMVLAVLFVIFIIVWLGGALKDFKTYY